jgi:hypothetical protein
MIFIYGVLIILIFFFVQNILNKEHFHIKTWTPYIIDKENQPGYSNYFYNNGYMYPIY